MAPPNKNYLNLLASLVVIKGSFASQFIRSSININNTPGETTIDLYRFLREYPNFFGSISSDPRMMGLSVYTAPHGEVAPHDRLTEAPTLEYYPFSDPNHSGKKMVCKLKIVARNHRTFEGNTDDLIYGTLEADSTPINGTGFKFTFEDVRFKSAALHVVWSIRASVYIDGELVTAAQVDLPGILVTEDPITPLPPLKKEDQPEMKEYKPSTF